MLKRSTCVLICTVWYNHVQLSIIEMSIHRHFKSKVNLLIPSQVQLSPNVLREVNQVVTAVLEREELGNQASKVKRESTTCLSCLRITLLLEGVACPLGNSQLLELQSGLYSAICNRLTMHSKPVLWYKTEYVLLPYMPLSWLKQCYRCSSFRASNIIILSLSDATFNHFVCKHAHALVATLGAPFSYSTSSS